MLLLKSLYVLSCYRFLFLFFIPLFLSFCHFLGEQSSIFYYSIFYPLILAYWLLAFRGSGLFPLFSKRKADGTEESPQSCRGLVLVFVRVAPFGFTFVSKLWPFWSLSQRFGCCYSMLMNLELRPQPLQYHVPEKSSHGASASPPAAAFP